MMHYLDVTPTMQSLRTTPEDFSLKGKWLVHRPSQHGFMFEQDGGVKMRAACACAELLIDPNQERPLYDSFRQWETNYWRPLRINREFAAHFRSPSWRWVLVRVMIRLTSWLAKERSEAQTVVAKEFEPLF